MRWLVPRISNPSVEVLVEMDDLYDLRKSGYWSLEVVIGDQTLVSHLKKVPHSADPITDRLKADRKFLAKHDLDLSKAVECYD